MKYISINTIRILLLLVIPFSALGNSVNITKSAEKNQVDSTITAVDKTDSTSLSNMSQAIISPPILRVVRGEKATFLSLSKSDSTLSLEWSSKVSKKSTDSKLVIDTSNLALGKQVIQLKITNEKGQASYTSATLIIFKNLESKQYAEDSHYFETLDKEITARIAKEKAMQEEELKELMAQADKSHVANKEDQTLEQGQKKVVSKSSSPSYTRIFIPIFLILAATIFIFIYRKELYRKYDFINSDAIENSEKQTLNNNPEPDTPPKTDSPDINFSFQIDRGSQKVTIEKEE